RIRRRVLFIEDGKIITNFNVPLVEIPLPPIPPLKLSELLFKLQKENFFNKAILSIAGGRNIPDKELRMQVGKQRIIQWGLIVLSVLLLLYALRRLVRARYRLEGSVPLVAAHLENILPTETLVVQRQRGMLQEGNLWEAARELAR